MCFGRQQRFSQSLMNSDTMKTEEASPVRNSRSAEKKQSGDEHSGQLDFVPESPVKGLPAVDICAGVTP